MSQYIKQQFNYQYTSTVIEMKIPGLTRDLLINDEAYSQILEDITHELKKFGAMRPFFLNGIDQQEVFIPRPKDINIYAGI
jgi:hypothetical protein